MKKLFLIILLLFCTNSYATAFTWDAPGYISLATYEDIGNLMKVDSNTLRYFYGRYLAETTKIYSRTYNISTAQWDASPTLIYTDPTYTVIGPVGGVIGNYIYVFYTNGAFGGSYHGIHYIRQAITGGEWSSPVTMGGTSDLACYCAFGHIVSTGTPGKYYQPFYGYTTCPGYAHTYVRLYVTTDYGENWSVGPTLYSGTTLYDETTVEYIGDNKFISLSRTNDGSYWRQSTTSNDFVSMDTSMVATNLGISSGVKMGDLIYDSEANKMVAIYYDRGSNRIKLASGDPLTVFSNEQAWSSQDIVATYSTVWSGYPTIQKISSNPMTYFATWTIEQSSSNADTFYTTIYSDWYAAVSGGSLNLGSGGTLNLGSGGTINLQ
jgi:hypothetical protein